MDTVTQDLKTAAVDAAVARADTAEALVLPTDHPALAGNGLSSGTVSTLCQYWPIARPVMEGLQHFLPAWTSFAFGILYRIGDAACGEK